VPFTLDLTFATNALANRTYLPVPLLIVAAIWYLVITSILMVGQHYIEAYYGKGVDNLAPAAGKPIAGSARVALSQDGGGRSIETDFPEESAR
jgi:polar amino acid transport system permease protein